MKKRNLHNRSGAWYWTEIDVWNHEMMMKMVMLILFWNIFTSQFGFFLTWKFASQNISAHHDLFSTRSHKIWIPAEWHVSATNNLLWVLRIPTEAWKLSTRWKQSRDLSDQSYRQLKLDAKNSGLDFKIDLTLDFESFWVQLQYFCVQKLNIHAKWS